MAAASPPQQQQQQQQHVAAPPVIRRLEESVVNRIAAGEVIQRPCSALKELLENSLDAGATQITVMVKEGGCKLLQITDDGHGIRKADLPLLCQRHTTSKLSTFEDLEIVSTLGFRGEALCSISFVSSMTVTTMTPNQLHGWRVSYKDSEMVVPPGPKPVASVPGTTITVEDLFYNVPTRRKALKSAAEEYARLLDVVSRYAVCKAGVAFCCKRYGEARPDVSTLASSSRLDNVRTVYGAAVAKELLPLRCRVGEEPTAQMGVDEPCSFVLEGYGSSANYAAKSSTFILFINGRLVEWPALRKAMEATYAAVLPKVGRPFILLFMRLPPRHVEVNMHPTKREVGVLNQEEVIEAVRSRLEALLSQSNATRTFATQPEQQPALLPAPRQAMQTTLQGFAVPMQQQQQRRKGTLTGGAGGEEPSGDEDEGQQEEQEDKEAALGPRRAEGGQARGAGSGGSGAAMAAPYRPQKLVRVDGRTRSMDMYLSSQYATTTPRAAALAGSISRKRRTAGAAPAAQLPGSFPGAGDPLAIDNADGGFSLADEDGAGAGGSAGAALGVCTQLDSVCELAAEVEAAAHGGLRELLREHVLVGMADDVHALVQHQTRLYLVNVHNLSRDLFYQQVLRSWERRPQPLVRLDPAPPVRDLVDLALTLEAAAGTWQEGEGGADEEEEEEARAGVCELAHELLQEKAPMLHDYLGLQVDPQGRLSSLPELLPGHVPDLGYLPDLVLALGKQVEWDEEQPCFRGLANVLADFYALKPTEMPVWAGQRQREPQQEPGSSTGCAGAAATETSSGVAPHDVDMANTGGVTKGGGQPHADERAGGAALGSGQRQQHQGGNEMAVAMDLDVDYLGVAAPAAGGVEEEGMGGGGGDGGSAGPVPGMWAGPGPPARQTQPPGQAVGGSADGGSTDGTSDLGMASTDDELGARTWMIKQVLFPAFRSLLLPGKNRAKDGTFLLVTSLEKLYRVFERC